MADHGRGGRGGRGDFRGRGRGDGGARGGRGDLRGRGRGDGPFRGGRGDGPFRGGRGDGPFRGGRGDGQFRGGRGDGQFRGGRGDGPFRGGRGGRGGFDPTRTYGDGVFPQPDAEVAKLEDSSVKDLSAALAATSLEDTLPRRPSYGKAGTPVILWTNYFELKGIKPNTELYRYSVAFPSNVEIPKPKKKRLIQLLLQRPPFAGTPVASDWAQILVSTKQIKLGDKRPKYDVEWYPADGEPLPPAAKDEPPRQAQARKRNTISLQVEMLGTVSLRELLADLRQPTVNYPLKLETIQALNILLGFGPSSDPRITTASGNKFYPFGSHPQMEYADLGSGLRALRGYFTSVRTSLNRVLVNINVATGAFYKDGPLLETMAELYNGPPQNQEQHRRLAAFVKKLRVETNYLRESRSKGGVKRKVHTITDLSAYGKNSTNVYFMWKDPKKPSGPEVEKSVQEYFQQTHGIILKKPEAPLVNYGTRDSPMWIPAELCTVIGGQLARRLLLGDQTRHMIEFAARRPFQNADSIMTNGIQVTKVSPGSNSHLTQFGIGVNPKLLTVQGRILQAPTLQYREKTCQPMNGAWNLDPRALGNKPFKLSKPLTSWNCLVINSGRYEAVRGGAQAITGVLGSFRQTLNTYGMNPGPVQQPMIMSVNPADSQKKDVSKIMKDIETAVRTGFKQRPSFLFILLPSDDAVLYDSIKTLFDVKFGIPTICSIAHKFTKEKGQMQYFANVAMKFNQKLGGINHVIDLKELSPLDNNTIVFGIDVTHPSPGSSEKSPSIAGVVASVDGNFAQYPASMRTQKGRQEMVSDLAEMISERLDLWRKRNGRLPSRVIVYRDGVSEGQYPIVLAEEYPRFVEAFNKKYGAAAKHPKISLIVVGKRHHTRFYPTDKAGMDEKTGNPKPGTVVDRGVTGEKLFDFFLLAHQGLQGTSKPAHYVVLKDENRLGADQLQKLTHNLCYTFARATRAVSVCPPAYYADLLCERGRSYLHAVLKGGDSAVDFGASHWQRDVHQNLAETMYYL